MNTQERDFIKRVNEAVPDKKDLERVDKIIADIPGSSIDPIVVERRSKKAVLQLNKITDHDKFCRRVKAFVDSGIKVDFTKCTIFTACTSAAVTKFLNNSAKVAAECLCDTIGYTEDFEL